MSGLPTVLVTDVVRSTRQGDSHGGAYLVDLETCSKERVLDWNTVDISWEGRGADRGLRGIAFLDDEILIAAADEVFVFDQQFEIRRSYKNRYLAHCHEIWLDGRTLYLTSTGYDSILELDMDSGLFTAGWWLDAEVRPYESMKIRLRRFDPERVDGPGAPQLRDALHINSVSRHEGATLLSGIRLPGLMQIFDGRLGRYAPIRPGTHNARVFRDGVIYNATGHDALVVGDRQGLDRRIVRHPRYPPGDLLGADIPEDHARQGFGRGLCCTDDLIVSGSSPTTITAFDANTCDLVRSVNVTMDVRHCPHGLEIWPFR